MPDAFLDEVELFVVDYFTCSCDNCGKKIDNMEVAVVLKDPSLVQLEKPHRQIRWVCMDCFGHLLVRHGGIKRGETLIYELRESW